MEFQSPNAFKKDTQFNSKPENKFELKI